VNAGRDRRTKKKPSTWWMQVKRVGLKEKIPTRRWIHGNNKGLQNKNDNYKVDS
jgi:hypothetical protein